MQAMWLWVKTNGIPFSTHFRSYFSGWIGMFAGAIWILTYPRLQRSRKMTSAFWSSPRPEFCPEERRPPLRLFFLLSLGTWAGSVFFFFFVVFSSSF